ncbi:MAG TPA: hypothetical protein EYP36_10720, partial [Calditrichaeota bacterium]|nr:hypothetical protein [Calditrichota bacterium]
MAQSTFVNPIMEGSDPWVIKKDSVYYGITDNRGESLVVWKSNKLTDRGIRRTVWHTPTSQEAWNFTDIWVIDATPLELNNKLYLIWFGWDSNANMENNGFTQQNLYIAEMENPYTVKTNRVKIAEPIYNWERSYISPQKLNEGPQILKHLNKIYLIYSTPDYWTIEYKMGQMEIETEKDPMNPANWYKNPQPVFEGTDDVYSVGHGSFVTSPDDSENWLMYHSKQTPEGGWHRDIRLQKFIWDNDGSPDFGVPLKAGTLLNKPSGEKDNVPGNEFTDNFDVDNSIDGFDNWQFFGWNGNLEIRDKQLLLGFGSFNLWNGDKALVRGYDWTDFTLETNKKNCKAVVALFEDDAKNA